MVPPERLRRLVARQRVVQARQLQSLPGGLLHDGSQPGNALIPPVAEQLRVQRAHDHPPARQRRPGLRRS